MHIDYNETEDILVYPYFRDTLLGIVQNDPNFPPTERKKILQHIGEAIQELHARDWIHIGAAFTICRSNSLLIYIYRREA
jgi:serine/threonine protein kinase